MKLTQCALAGALLMLSGCGSDTINLVISPRTGKFVPNPKKGDVVRFSARGADKSVTFSFGVSPCVETNITGTCTVNADAPSGTPAGYYLYKCPDNSCVDPEIIVGSDIEPIHNEAMLHAARGAPTPVGIICLNGNAMIDPTPIRVSAGENIVWYPDGSAAQQPKKWSISSLADTCTDSTQINQDHSSCTIRADAPPTSSYTLTVTEPAMCKPATGEIDKP